LAPSVNVINPNSTDDSAPAIAAASTPSHGAAAVSQGSLSARSGSPHVKVTAKPVMAPHSIMPSMPRFSTPLFSTTSSPVAARRIGVVMLTTVRNAEMMRSRLMRALPRHPRESGDPGAAARRVAPGSPLSRG
jgi:hypothetical protein